MEEAAHEGRPLYDECCDEQVEADTRKPVALQKRHEVSEPDKYHHVHVLEHCNYKLQLLPPASEGWGKVLFSVCLSVHTSTGGGGLPQPGLDGGGVPRPGLDGGGQGIPQSGLDGGGGYPSQVWMVGGVPQPGLDGGRVPGVPPIRQSSIASTCYPAGGPPLAFTQEDFLLLSLFCN